MTLSNRKCQFLYKKKVGRTLIYEVSPLRGVLSFGYGPRKRYFCCFVIRFRTQTQNHGIAVDIINFAEIAYHQNEVLYIIKPQIDAR